MITGSFISNTIGDTTFSHGSDGTMFTTYQMTDSCSITNGSDGSFFTDFHF